MLHVFGPAGAHLVSPGNEAALSNGFVWMDCFQPTREEERLVETTLGIEIPTRQEMLEIEVSNRLYIEGAVCYLTTTLISRSETDMPEASPVTFILTPNHLITLRFSEFMPFRTFIAEFQRNAANFPRADQVFAGLLDRITERLADMLEKVGGETEILSNDLFKNGLQQKLPQTPAEKKQKKASLRVLLQRVGKNGNMTAKIRESLVSLFRMLTFLNEGRTSGFCNEAKMQLTTTRSDILSLTDHSHFLADKITFLLDATLGMINIEQNDIIRVFSIAAVMFMPPTLITSLYGMNFKNMPELGWTFGYEYALGFIFLSTLLPFFVFKKKGWL